VANEEYMSQFCRRHNFARWFETSARENTNVEISILFLIGEVRKTFEYLNYILFSISSR
jgi:hypothetical protein